MPSFGNGFITYNKPNNIESWVLMLQDVTRIGEDYFKFCWTYEFIHVTIAGVKGSCWVVHNEIEKKFGFDVGLKRSVGEDWSCCFMWSNFGG